MKKAILALSILCAISSCKHTERRIYIDLPEEIPSEGDILQVISVSHAGPVDTLSFGYVHPNPAVIQFAADVDTCDLNSNDVFRILARKGDTIIMTYYQ